MAREPRRLPGRRQHTPPPDLTTPVNADTHFQGDKPTIMSLTLPRGERMAVYDLLTETLHYAPGYDADRVLKVMLSHTIDNARRHLDNYKAQQERGQDD